MGIPSLDKIIASLKPFFDLFVEASRTGDLGLVFSLIGTLLTLVAFFYGPSIFGYVILALGGLIVLAGVFFFYYQKYIQVIKPIHYTQEQITRNQDIVKTIGASAIQMAALVRNLNELMYGHASKVSAFIDQHKQIVEDINLYVQHFGIPGAQKFGEIVDNKKEKALADTIMLRTFEINEVIKNIEVALSESDLKLLEKYQDQLKELVQKVQEIRKTIDNPQPKDQSD